VQLELLESVGRYEIVGELGAGAMSKVYLAHDPNLDRKLALKVLLQAWSFDTEEQGELEKRFLLEARAAGKLSHPNIVRVFDADTDPETGIPYIAMEWIQGGSFAELLTQENRLSGPETLTLLSQVARALDYAHQFGRIHRDIKPSNILITRDGTAKVSDFGVAKIVAETHTISGQVLGTPAYMSPEQVRDEPLDGRSDLFSLGAVLYQCVTGRTPFGGDSLVQIVYKILNVDPRPVGLPRTEAWILLTEIIDRALRKDPQTRYQSGAQFAEFLEAARMALADEEDHEFRKQKPTAKTDSAKTVRFQTPAPRSAATGSGIGPTRTIQLSNTEIRRAVVTDPNPSDPLLDTVVTAETTAVVGKKSRWGWVGSIVTLLLLAATGSLVAARWLDRQESEARQRLATARQVVSSPLFTASLVEANPIDVPSQPPGWEIPAEETPNLDASIVPAPTKKEPEPARSAVLLPPSALSRTGVNHSNGKGFESRKQSILTPVTIMYRHKGGDATLQVFLDGVRIWNQHLEAVEGRKQKLLGYDSRAVVSIPSGEHALEVRLTDPDRAIDASDTVLSRYTNGRKRSLRINLDPNDNVIQLRWKE
jgi:serine/threonine protein kinase